MVDAALVGSEGGIPADKFNDQFTPDLQKDRASLAAMSARLDGLKESADPKPEQASGVVLGNRSSLHSEIANADGACRKEIRCAAGQPALDVLRSPDAPAGEEYDQADQALSVDNLNKEFATLRGNQARERGRQAALLTTIHRAADAASRTKGRCDSQTNVTTWRFFFGAGGQDYVG